MNGVVQWLRSGPAVLKVAVAAVAILAGIALLAGLRWVVEGVFVVIAVAFVIALCAIPLVLLGFAVYGVAQLLKGRDGGGDHRVHASSPAPGPSPEPAPSPQPEAGRSTPPTPTPSVTLPPELAAAVSRIRDKARALQSPEQSPLLQAEDRQRIESLINEFLPQALATYQSLPRGSHEWEVEAGGSTPRQVLERHLTLLEESLDAIARRVFEAGAAELVAQGKFLEETLRTPDAGDLHLNGTGTTPSLEPGEKKK
jgi:hypothetical protein